MRAYQRQPSPRRRRRWTLAGDYQYQDAGEAALPGAAMAVAESQKGVFPNASPIALENGESPPTKAKQSSIGVSIVSPEPRARPCYACPAGGRGKRRANGGVASAIGDNTPAGGKNWQDRYVWPLAGRTIHHLCRTTTPERTRYCQMMPERTCWQPDAPSRSAACPGCPRRGTSPTGCRTGTPQEDLRDELDGAIPMDPG